MSLNPDAFEPVRLEYYAAKLFTGQNIIGKVRDYGHLKKTYQIAIISEGNFFSDDKFLHGFIYYDPENKVKLKGKTRIITMELSKVKSLIEKPVEKTNAQERWALYFRYLTDKSKREKINQIISEEEGIAMASKVLIKISKNDRERARLISEEKYELDTQSRLSTEVRKAKQLGKLEGRLEIIDLLKSGKSHEEIIREYES